MTPIKDALEPCPFCKSRCVTATVDEQNWKIVECDDCGARGPCIELEGDLYIERWNTRATLTTPAQGRDALRDRIEEILQATKRNPLMVGFVHSRPTVKELQERLDLVAELTRAILSELPVPQPVRGNLCKEVERLNALATRFERPSGDILVERAALPQIAQDIRSVLSAIGVESAWKCAARRQSMPEPADCDWPNCGCDPRATKVIENLVEQGWGLLPVAPVVDEAGIRADEREKCARVAEGGNHGIGILASGIIAQAIRAGGGER